jgi:hypothetical protein
MSISRRPLGAALGLFVATLVGCGNAHAHRNPSSPNLVVVNDTARTLKVFVVEDEDVDIADMGDPLDELSPGSYGTYRVTRGERTVITERYGENHDPHRRAKVHFRSGMAHVVTVSGPSQGLSPEAIAQAAVRPGTVITYSP